MLKKKGCDVNMKKKLSLIFFLTMIFLFAFQVNADTTTPTKATVKFNAQGGTVTPLSKTYTVGTPVGTMPTATAKGFQFLGWYTEARGGKRISTRAIVKRNVTVYAHWKRRTYTITYNLNGGTNSTSNLNTFVYNKAQITLAPATKKGYTFGGWYLDKGLTKRVGGIAKGYARNVVLYAKWTPVSYKIRFNANGGSGTMSDVTYKSGTSYTLPANKFTKSGQTFVGWNTKADGTGISFGNASKIRYVASRSKTYVFYAQWTTRAEKAIFPMKVMQIFQLPYEKWSGSGSDTGASHANINAIDFGGCTMAAPFTGHIKWFSRDWALTIFESDNKVRYADGTYDYMTLELLHAPNLAQLETWYKNNTQIKQGVRFYQQGGTGEGGNLYAYGTHIEMRVHRGKMPATITFQGDVFAYDAFFVKRSYTTSIYNYGALTQNNIFTQAGVPKDWTNKWRFIN